MSRSMDLLQAPIVTKESEISQTRHLMDLLGAANETNHQTQRLSLPLGSHMLGPSLNFGIASSSYLLSEAEDREVCNPGVGNARGDDYSLTANTFSSVSTSLHRPLATTYGSESFATAIENSRYLKPTESLLDEVVNIGGKNVDENFFRKLYKGARGESSRISSELKAEFCCIEIQLPEHELRVGLAKLIGLLEEVELRYEKYYQQMEEVVSSFESIAGLGAEKSYTALALQAMSRHFGNLRDAIVSQINVTRRKFLHDLPRTNAGLSQHSLFDRDSRQNRQSLQQLGIITSQRQAWRPIIGLPETSVAILRSWLFEHFLHPYPTDSEKLMLASQTGLTKNQISNWFTNARVRLWKPMIEEMYREEIADSSQDSDSSFANSSIVREATTDQAED
ncbi:BEL1-like homeodomain protein 11 [Hibiscus syriacus]|uniref:BEL1-like homeodomain protein 11 n=2 Tax=Hibiscus syriacus TaxID=106335 RepID=A0A6A3B758_HIBSY|nr:BEL1-like homeodomain protein 11 [Hibiscus syriacus]